MSGEETEQDKSELPTQHKLKKSREQGQVARGMDLGFFAGLGAFLCFAWLGGSMIMAAMARTMRGVLAAAPNISENGLLHLTGSAFLTAARPVTLLAGTIFVVVLLFEFLQTGVVFSSKPLKPDFSRLNPAKGLKRLFSLRLLIETAKNVLKLIVYGTIAALLIKQAMGLSWMMSDARGLVAELRSAGLRLIAWFLLVALMFVVIDQLIIRRDFLKRMRMSRRELRREVRDREGEPRLKQRRKQLHAEFVKLSQSLRGIRGADVLIVNPVHYAIALRYDGKRHGAPIVVARGANGIALRLKRLAFLYGVKIVEHPQLARALYRNTVLDREIPEQYYGQVADIYRALRTEES